MSLANLLICSSSGNLKIVLVRLADFQIIASFATQNLLSRARKPILPSSIPAGYTACTDARL